MKQIFLILFCVIFKISSNLFAQKCDIVFKGKVSDELTGMPLSFAAIYIEESQQGVLSDENGDFEFANLCISTIHVRISHVSCSSEVHFVELLSDSIVEFRLHHHSELLNELQIHGKNAENTTQKNVSLSTDQIIKNGNQNLAEILEQITGVASIKNGSGIAKPIIHGLWGNRISILNNGIAQNGQQWGADHAPEIDALSADHLSVVKGVSALAYPGNSLGGVVLIENSPINDEPHVHGAINYVFNSNGFGNALNVKMEQSAKFFDWRINGTYKVQGDAKSPNYFLTNTGKQEGSFSLQLEKKINSKLTSSAYYSNFSTEIGMLLGSQIGNVTDLTAAFSREIPFYTSANFSFSINAPKQTVNHQLLKLKLNKILSDKAFLAFVYGGQINNRKEFDNRRGGLSDVAALSLIQISNYFEGNYIKEFKRGKSIKTGIQYTITDNTNKPGTGISPLIPDYRAFNTALFGIYKIDRDNWLHEFGLKAENKLLNVVQITRTIPKTIIRNNHVFNFFSSSIGSTKKVNSELTFSYNFGMAMRPPEVNELYSFGLHQGVSSIEVGNENLKNEQSFKALLSMSYRYNDFFFLEVTPYFNQINNYIYLQPQKDYLLTIRGAFPLFNFEQTNGLLYGTDLLISLEPNDNSKWITKLSYVKGIDLSQAIPLVNIPPLSVSSTINYSVPNIKKFTNNNIEIEVQYHDKQRNLLASQDFVLAPDAYTLINLGFTSEVQLRKNYLNWGIKTTNLLNTTYRNYLNRLRYFADDVGRNIVFFTKIKF